MENAEKLFRDSAEKKPQEILQEYIVIFKNRGWLDRTIRIKHREKKYRISCTETGFIAYRVNDHCGISPGIPGGPVCFVTHDHIIDDSDMSAFVSTEPSALDWLRCIASGDLELI